MLKANVIIQSTIWKRILFNSGSLFLLSSIALIL